MHSYFVLNTASESSEKSLDDLIPEQPTLFDFLKNENEFSLYIFLVNLYAFDLAKPVNK